MNIFIEEPLFFVPKEFPTEIKVPLFYFLSFVGEKEFFDKEIKDHLISPILEKKRFKFKILFDFFRFPTFLI